MFIVLIVSQLQSPSVETGTLLCIYTSRFGCHAQVFMRIAAIDVDAWQFGGQIYTFSAFCSCLHIFFLWTAADINI